MLKQAQPSKNILEEENSMEQATLQHQWVHAGSGHGKVHQLEQWDHEFYLPNLKIIVIKS